MYKVLIVDDDRIIRRGLVTTIPWEENGFMLVGEAGDGERALELIDMLSPQIVISDIRMPFMDGLAMAEQVKRKHPDIRFIFLTGYEDFNYAKQALKLGAVDYLLKPVNREVILEKAAKAAADWEAEQSKRDKIHTARPYFRQMFFHKLLEKTADETALLAEAESLEVRFKGKCFVVMVLKLDGYKKAGSLSASQEMKAAVSREAENLLLTKTSGGVFGLEDDEIAVVCSGDDTEEKIFSCAGQLAAEFCAAAKEKQHTTLTIGIGKAWTGLHGIAESFHEAKYVLEFRHVIGKDKVISVNDLDALVNEVQNVSRTLSESELVDKVRMGFVDDALQLLSEVETVLQASRLSLTQVRLMAVDILLALFKGADEWAHGWSQENRDKKAVYYDKINQMPTVEDIMVLLRTVVDSLGQFMASENENQRGEIIDEVTAYIEEHYAEHGLSLQDIGAHVHMNPIYLSVLFKKKKNITFTGFLLQVRMKKAMEMLRCRDLKNYEVAEQTGYSSPEYFCACFKKYTGMSPAEFRNKN